MRASQKFLFSHGFGDNLPSGYNFPSLDSIRPYLESAGEGSTGTWARETAKRLKCKVCVGYPEVQRASSVYEGQPFKPSGELEEEKYYNSLLVVDENGEILHNYRKSFLYYTDVTWAAEGSSDRGFRTVTFDSSSNRSSTATTGDNNAVANLPRDEEKTRQIATSFGICMDINPYRFEAPFTAWELANRVLDSKSQLVIISMAWLSLLSREELDSLADKPDMDTLQYWILRFWPLVERKMAHKTDLDGPNGDKNQNNDPSAPKKVVIVFANRAGEEEGHGEAQENTSPVRYAGTSAILAVTQRPAESVDDDDDDDVTAAGKGKQARLDVKILCWDLLGATEEGICFADTTRDPKMVFGLAKRKRSGQSEGSDDESD